MQRRLDGTLLPKCAGDVKLDKPKLAGATNLCYFFGGGPDRGPTLLGSFDDTLSARGAESAFGLRSFRLGGSLPTRVLADGSPHFLLCVGDPLPRGRTHLPAFAAGLRRLAALLIFGAAAATTEFLPNLGNAGIKPGLLSFESFDGCREYLFV